MTDVTVEMRVADDLGDREQIDIDTVAPHDIPDSMPRPMWSRRCGARGRVR